MQKTKENAENIYNIPAGIAFSTALAAKITEETKKNPENLSKYRILLPTRRACRVLRDSFLQLTNGKPLLLPQLQSIGDVDVEELSFQLTDKSGLRDFVNLPPAIPPIKRQLMLAKTIQAAQKQQGHDALGFSHAMALAKALGAFMDQIYTEGLEFNDLINLVPAEFADHWQITLDFLKILSENWPKILEENKVIDIAKRRNILIETLAGHWDNTKPDAPIIAAGTTGSIPAVATLLKTISQLPQGRIILPGFDMGIEEEDWNTLDETHPQYGFKLLLNRLDIPKEHVQTWPHTQPIAHTPARQALAREIMRSAETTLNWTNISQNNEHRTNIIDSTHGIEYYDTDTPQEEATLIATLMRETLETPEQTAALITPDRNLARRVSAICKRWNIEIDDSSGYDLSGSTIGLFMRTALDALNKNLSPIAFLSLLKQNINGQSKERTLEIAIAQLEMNILRGLKPRPGINGMEERITNLKQKATPHNTPTELTQATTLCSQLEPILNIFYNELDKDRSLKTIIKSHIEFCENLLSITHEATATLWSEQEGEEAARLICELLEHSGLITHISAEDYAETFAQLLKTVTIRPHYGTHPRLAILGQLEARMIDCDLLILSGLNEGTWPSDAGHDPWMSRPMRKDFGLPSPERAIGLAAHDFAQGMCQGKTILTRAKTNSGAPTVPARWLQRFDTVLQSCGTNLSALSTGPYLDWVRTLDASKQTTPTQRPAPTPPLNARPNKLSVTKIETWMKDPYAIYAGYVLKLRPLEPIEKPTGAAERGTLLHNIFDRFIQTHQDELNDNGIKILTNFGQEEIAALSIDPDSMEFWWPRFHRTANWFIQHEQNWRTQATPIETEAYGEIEITAQNTALTLTGRADRIDHTYDGGYAIIDYKSGGTYRKKEIQNGKTPQLALEALILNSGGFQDIPAGASSHLSYWIMNGGKPAGKTVILDENIEELIEKTRENLITLINEFDKESTPYYAIPNLNNMPRFNDYEHLARVKEWASLEQNSTEAA